MAAFDAAGWGLWGGIARGCACCGRRRTRSVGIAPLLIGCTATDRVYRDVTGAAPLVRSRGEHVEAVWLRPMRTVGVCGEELPSIGLVVGGGAPDP